jgi:hypothetical protein
MQGKLTGLWFCFIPQAYRVISRRTGNREGYPRKNNRYHLLRKKDRKRRKEQKKHGEKRHFFALFCALRNGGVQGCPGAFRGVQCVYIFTIEHPPFYRSPLTFHLLNTAQCLAAPACRHSRFRCLAHAPCGGGRRFRCRG